MSGSSEATVDYRYQRRLPMRLKRARYSQMRINKFAPDSSESSGTGGETVSKEQVDSLTERYQSQMKRLQSEFENFRRRSRKEKQELQQNAASDLIGKLLDVVDNFSRAVENPGTNLDSFVQGVQMIHSQFTNLLRETGLEEIQCEGQAFDPNFHEAVAVDDSGDKPENTVVQVMQPGFMHNGKLLRPALVKVARLG